MQESTELINSAGPGGLAVAAADQLDATASADLSLVRGIDAGAGFDLTAALAARASGGPVAATFRAGVEAAAAVMLRAQFPLDLFGTCGVESQIRAEAGVGLELL